MRSFAAYVERSENLPDCLPIRKRKTHPLGGFRRIKGWGTPSPISNQSAPVSASWDISIPSGLKRNEPTGRFRSVLIFATLIHDDSLSFRHSTTNDSCACGALREMVSYSESHTSFMKLSAWLTMVSRQ